MSFRWEGGLFHGRYVCDCGFSIGYHWMYDSALQKCPHCGAELEE